MALTVTKLSGPVSIGSRYQSVTKIDFDNSYATGGLALTAAQLGLNAKDPNFNVTIQSKLGYVFHYDHTNQKVLAYQAAAHTHDLLYKDADQADGATTRVNAATNKVGANTGSSITVTGQAAGASAHGGVLGIAAGALAEVANTTDLSSVTGVRVTATGIRR